MDYKGGTLIELKSTELGRSRADLLVRCRIIEIVFDFCWLDTASRYRDIERNIMAKDESALVQPLVLYRFEYFGAFSQLLRDVDYPVGHPGGLARFFDPPVIEPSARRNLAAIVKPALLFQAGIHRLTFIDQRDLAGDRNPRTILLPNFGEYLITQRAPHRTNIVEIGQLHAAQVSNLTNKFYKRSPREIFEQEIAENPEEVLLDRNGG